MTKEIIKFSIVGLINFTIEYTVFFIIYRIIKINYIFAVFNAYSIMILSSYFLNKKWTFKSKFKSKSKNKYQILKYIIIYISVLILRILIIKIIIKKTNLIVEISNIISMIAGFIIIFFSLKLCVFGGIDE